ncbi:MAG TPA: hypothetical protein PKN87_01465 [Syntrophomonadaceae bacterium]|nr:hypothetical protein [Syntrophomonadaceae bacterium]HPR93381.1 hypothetical protein [Syntrophomonadaceae bacterium]
MLATQAPAGNVQVLPGASPKDLGLAVTSSPAEFFACRVKPCHSRDAYSRSEPLCCFFLLFSLI